MKNKLPVKRTFLLGLFLFFLLPLPVRAERIFTDVKLIPKPATGWVNDAAGLLTAEEEAAISREISLLEEHTSVEIGVATIPTTQPLTPKEYATELFQAWGVGKKGKDNGLLILVAVEERRVEIETGYGLEGILPDGRVGRILDTAVVPYLREGAFGQAILSGVKAFAAVINAEYSPEVRRADRRTPDLVTALGYGLLAFMLSLFLLSLLVVRLRPRKCPQCGGRLRIEREVLVPPSTLHEGRERVTTTCTRCDYRRVAEVVIPLLAAETVRRSFHFRGPGGFDGFGGGGFGSGGFGGDGGFGGGSSGGGGAGRSW